MWSATSRKLCNFFTSQLPRERRRTGKGGVSSRMQRGSALEGRDWVQPPAADTYPIQGGSQDKLVCLCSSPDIRQGQEQKQNVERNHTPLLPTQCLRRNYFLAVVSAFLKIPAPARSLWCFSDLIGNSQVCLGLCSRMVNIVGIAECHLLHIWRNFLTLNSTLTC